MSVFILLLVGEGEACLLDLKFLCSWSQRPLEISRLLGRCLVIRLVIRHG